MATASNARTQLGIVKEVTFGVTPTDPTFAAQKHSNESISLAIEELLDDSKSLERDYRFTMNGNRSVSGSIDGPLAHTNYDLLLESALFNTWTTNTLKLGNNRQSLTIEKKTDNGNYFLYNGMVVNSLSVNTSNSEAPNVSFELLGMRESSGSVSVSEDPYTAPADIIPFTVCGGTITEGGAPLAAVSAVNFTLTNGVTAEYYWGNCDVGDLKPGRIEITGTLEVFFESLVLYNKFKNKTQTSLSFTLTNGTQTMTFSLPRIFYTGADMPSTSGNDSLVMSLPFRAVYSPTDTTSLVITRSA